MNGRQAKRLRRAALGLATTLSDAGLSIKKDGYTEMKHHDPSLSPSSVYDPKGVLPKGATQQAFGLKAPSHQLKVRSDSLKGIYRGLKSGKAT